MQIEMGQELREQKREAADIRKDISTARGLIHDALTRYVKKKIGARNKSQVEEQTLLYAELDLYNTRNDIHDAYGWAFITEKQMDRLFAMWDAREVARRNAGRYVDRVTEILQRAMDGLGEAFEEQLSQIDEDERCFLADVERIERENAQHSYERRQESLRWEQFRDNPGSEGQDCAEQQEMSSPELCP